MNRHAYVHADLDGRPILVGRLFARERKRRETATFEYDETWLAHVERYALEPALRLGPGPFHTRADKALFGAIGDSAPDRWGRMLMRRAERRRASDAGETPRTLREIDYLLLVNDETRMGALRFATEQGGPFLAARDSTPVPPPIVLPKLLSAAQHVIDGDETDEDLRLIFAPGSSLGGARPKASVRERDGSIAIAKFPHKEDEWNTVAWEAVALSLAEMAGITVPRWRVENIAGKDVLILGRFDREGAVRIPFLSAMSMLGAADNETRSYLEIADALSQQGSNSSRDLQELWKRMVFNVLVSNVDDHLRNHGFLYAGSVGCTLSPAYDLNPTPVDVKPRVLCTAINEDDQTASLKLALSVAEYFELDEDGANAIAAQVGRVIVQWRTVAARFRIRPAEIDRMASAFMHDDLKQTLVIAP